VTEELPAEAVEVLNEFLAAHKDGEPAEER
jgi:hypothetical protein